MATMRAQLDATKPGTAVVAPVVLGSVVLWVSHKAGAMPLRSQFRQYSMRYLSEENTASVVAVQVTLTFDPLTASDGAAGATGPAVSVVVGRGCVRLHAMSTARTEHQDLVPSGRLVTVRLVAAARGAAPLPPAAGQ